MSWSPPPTSSFDDRLSFSPTRLRVALDHSPFLPQAGDVVFGNRLSWVQMAKNVTADQWTHIAVVAEQAGDTVAVEMGPKGCGTRPLADFCAAYRYVGFARLAASPSCRATVARSAVDHIGGPLNYAWSHFVAAGLASASRRFGRRRNRDKTIRRGRRGAELLDRMLGPEGAVCSSFVWDCLHSPCAGCAPATMWPIRAAVAPWHARPTVTDVDHDWMRSGGSDPGPAERILLSPSDLWVADNYAFKLVIDGPRVTQLYDLRQPRRAASPCVLAANSTRATAAPVATNQRDSEEVST